MAQFGAVDPDRPDDPAPDRLRRWHQMARAHHRSLLTPDDWNHVAVSFDGITCLHQTIDQGDDSGVPELVALEGGTPASSPITTIGAHQDGVHGTINEVRI